MIFAIIAALLILALLVFSGLQISLLATIAVLLTIGYITATSVKKLRANRKEALACSRQQEVICDNFCQGLNRLEEARKLFVSATSHLSQEEQTSLWEPVIEVKVRACHFLLAHDFARANVFLSTATQTAEGLLAQYQAA